MQDDDNTALALSWCVSFSAAEPHFRGVCQLLSRLLETLFKLCSAPAFPGAFLAQPCYTGVILRPPK